MDMSVTPTLPINDEPDSNERLIATYFIVEATF
jgi:hypothetical protein